MQQIRIENKDSGQRFDKFLGRHLSGTGMGFIYKMLRKKNITLNGKKADGKELLKEDDLVTFFFSDETYRNFTHQEEADTTLYKEAYSRLKDIEILYEDEQVLFLNKPAGILSQRAEGETLSVNEWMIGYLLDSGQISPLSLASFKPSVCNRLDRNTSGLVLCGKSLCGSRELNRLIKERKVRKFYRLFVKGCLNRPGMLEGFLSKDQSTNTVTVHNTRSKASESSIRTGYRPILWNPHLSYVEAELFTGKTHQIRAHFASLGHPLAGDPKYGDPSFNQRFWKKYGKSAQLLHAARIEFPQDCGSLQALNGMCLKAPLPMLYEEILKEELWQPGIPVV